MELDLPALRGRLVIDECHIGRHLKASCQGVLGANIDYAETVEGLLLKRAVNAFLQGVAYILDHTCKELQILELCCPDEVGFEGVALINDLPEGSKVWREDREGLAEVNVTDAKPPRTHWLTFIFSLKVDPTTGESYWFLGTIYAGKASQPFKNVEWWREHAFYDLRGNSQIKEE